MTSLDKAGQMLARAIDRIDALTDRLWLCKMKAILFIASKMLAVNMKLYDKVMAVAREIEGAEI